MQHYQHDQAKCAKYFQFLTNSAVLQQGFIATLQFIWATKDYDVESNLFKL